MSDRSTARRLVPLNAVLAVLALALVVVLVVLLVGGGSDAGSSADKRSRAAYDDVAKAAKAETLAFMDVDYRAMDKRIAKVLAGATGQFKAEYEQSKTQLTSAVQSEKSISSGTVLSTGVSSLDQDSATVFVAANSSVENSSTKGKKEPRYYRLQLDLTKVKDRWLVSKLQFVG